MLLLKSHQLSTDEEKKKINFTFNKITGSKIENFANKNDNDMQLSICCRKIKSKDYSDSIKFNMKSGENDKQALYGNIYSKEK